MTSLANLSTQERSERARVIESLMTNSMATYDYETVAWFNSIDKSPNDVFTVEPEKVLKMALLPRRLSKFLRAALLIRHNYSHWCELLKDITQPLPIQLESVLEDKMLVFLLIWCDAIKVFHLNPEYPFLICEHSPEVSRNFPIYDIYTVDGDLRITQLLLDLWNKIQMPEKVTVWGKELTEVADRLQNGNPSGKIDDLNIGDIFYKAAHAFDLSFLSDDSGEGCYTEKVSFDLNELVLKCSAAVALDSSDSNTLEIVLELFPQFPELVGEISKHYVLSSRKYFEYDSSIRTKILREIFDHQLLDFSFNERTPLRNQSILSMIKAHPQMYARWAVEPKLRILYRKLIDPVSRYE